MSTLLKKAELYCKKMHTGQVRKYTNEPYHTHPIAVCHILAHHGANEVTQVAGLLHDIIEDTTGTYEEIETRFGKSIADLVLEVTDVSTLSDGNRKTRKELDLQHLRKSSPEGATIKLADLLHNTRSIVKYDPNFAKVYLEEKLELLKVLTHGNYNLWYSAFALANLAKEELKSKEKPNDPSNQ